MSAEGHVTGNKQGVRRTPADKTDAPRRVRNDQIRNLPIDDFVQVESSTSLAQTIARMTEDEGGCAIVCEGERVVGIFTERDLITKIIGAEVDLSSAVGDWMSESVEMLPPDATLGQVVRVMEESGYRNIPVVEEGRLVGSVSVFDVITYLAESYPKETMNLPPVPAQVMDKQEGG